MQTAERLVFFLVLFSPFYKDIAPTLIGAIFFTLYYLQQEKFQILRFGNSH